MITLKLLRFSFQLSDEHIIAFNSLWGHHSFWTTFNSGKEEQCNASTISVPNNACKLIILIWFWELYVEAGLASCGSVMCAE